MTETAAINISQAVDFEMKRIRRALETSDGDKEDLVTYAKEIVSLRYPAPAMFASRHNDETGECEPVEIDTPMLSKLQDRASRIRSCLLDKPEAVEGDAGEIDRLRAIALDMQTGYLEATERAEEAVKAANALQIEIARLRRELEEARKALAPFARAADRCKELAHGLPVVVNINECRAARAALRAGEEGR